MKVTTPEISWHERDPVYSADFQPGTHSIQRIVTAGVDKYARVWNIPHEVLSLVSAPIYIYTSLNKGNLQCGSNTPAPLVFVFFLILMVSISLVFLRNLFFSDFCSVISLRTCKFNLPYSFSKKKLLINFFDFDKKNELVIMIYFFFLCYTSHFKCI